MFTFKQKSVENLGLNGEKYQESITKKGYDFR